VEPHYYGVRRDGKELHRAFQISGHRGAAPALQPQRQGDGYRLLLFMTGEALVQKHEPRKEVIR